MKRKGKKKQSQNDYIVSLKNAKIIILENKSISSKNGKYHSKWDKNDTRKSKLG